MWTPTSSGGGAGRLRAPTEDFHAAFLVASALAVVGVLTAVVMFGRSTGDAALAAADARVPDQGEITS